MCGASWKILTNTIIKFEGDNSKLKQAYGTDTKTTLSILFFVIGIAAAFFYPVISLILYILVACTWFIPDRRIEKQMKV